MNRGISFGDNICVGSLSQNESDDVGVTLNNCQLKWGKALQFCLKISSESLVVQKQLNNLSSKADFSSSLIARKDRQGEINYLV
jgi:hypothetical protein